MRAVVFCGSSISHEDAAEIFAAEFRPPVGKGDIDRLMSESRPPDMIGIVDGRFLHSLSISPKEILRAMDADVTVYGSSSMGALRAVECAPYGMIGIGKIFEEFHSGRTDEDDEVAITYLEENARPLSEPLINMRFSIAEALRAGLLSPRLAEDFLRVAKELYFPERSVAAVLHRLRPDISEQQFARLKDYLCNHAPDTKRDDAMALLRRMRDDSQRRGEDGGRS